MVRYWYKRKRQKSAGVPGSSRQGQICDIKDGELGELASTQI